MREAATSLSNRLGKRDGAILIIVEADHRVRGVAGADEAVIERLRISGDPVTPRAA